MTGGIRWSAAVLAGLCWVFLTRLGTDLISGHGLTLQLIAPPLVVSALYLPYRAGAVTLGLVALLYDAASGAPFGITASIALPAHLLLFRIRRQLTPVNPLTGAGLALAVAPALHLGFVGGLAIGAREMPSDTIGLLLETGLVAVVSALATPWLTGLTLSALDLFGITLDRGGYRE